MNFRTSSRRMSGVAEPKLMPNATFTDASLDRHENAVAHLAVDGLGEMALAGGVLDEDDLAGTDHARLAVARGDLHARIEVDDVLSSRRRMPVQVVGGLDLAEDDAVGGQALGELAGPALLGPLDLDVTEV